MTVLVNLKSSRNHLLHNENLVQCKRAPSDFFLQCLLLVTVHLESTGNHLLHDINLSQCKQAIRLSSTLNSPIPAPTTILPVRSMNLSEANPRTSEPAVNTRLAIIITSFLPILSLSIPPTMANKAAPPIVTLTIISCHTEFRRNLSRSEIMAPEITPVSYPKRKPPIAEKNVSM